MKEYFRKPYMTQAIIKHMEYMKAIPQKAIDVQGIIAPNIEFKKPYKDHANTPQMIHYYENTLDYLGGNYIPQVAGLGASIEPRPSLSVFTKLMLHLNSETQFTDSSLSRQTITTF